MNLQLNDKVIVVNDGAKGIGEGILRLLAQEDAIPVIIGRHEAYNKALSQYRQEVFGSLSDQPLKRF